MPMPTADCRLLHHGRIMRCLTYLFLLPESLKKSKKVGGLPGRLPVCYEILTLSLTSTKKKQKEKMAAELYPAAGTDATSLASGTTVEEKPGEVPLSPASSGGGSAATTPSSQQNITNNNTEPAGSWHCSHPTLRERYPHPGGENPHQPAELLRTVHHGFKPHHYTIARRRAQPVSKISPEH